MENHGGIILAGKNCCFIHQSFLASIPEEPSDNKAGGTDKGILQRVLNMSIKF
jgi:hypothetical protein